MQVPFWYRLTRVVPVKGPLNGCVCAFLAAILLNGESYKRAVIQAIVVK